MKVLRTLAYVAKALKNGPSTLPTSARLGTGTADPVIAQAPSLNVQARSDDAAATDLQQSDQSAVMEIRESEGHSVIDMVPNEDTRITDMPQGGETAVIDLLHKEEDAVIDLLHKEEDAVIDLLQTEIETLHTYIAEAKTGGAVLNQTAPNDAQLRREVEFLHSQLTEAIKQLGWERERADILNREAIARMERRLLKDDELVSLTQKEQMDQRQREQERLLQEKREQERLARLARLEQRFTELSKDVIVELSLDRQGFWQRLRRR